MSNEQKIIDFIKQIPDHILLSESARRVAQRRTAPYSGRPKKVRKCKFCDLSFGVREMKKHVSEVHPGGMNVDFRSLRRGAKMRPCQHCGEPYTKKGMRTHLKKRHADVHSPQPHFLAAAHPKE